MDTVKQENGWDSMIIMFFTFFIHWYMFLYFVITFL
jgi:hypothetical protein